jgi:hypothetical protein
MLRSDITRFLTRKVNPRLNEEEEENLLRARDVGKYIFLYTRLLESAYMGCLLGSLVWFDW